MRPLARNIQEPTQPISGVEINAFVEQGFQARCSCVDMLKPSPTQITFCGVLGNVGKCPASYMHERSGPVWTTLRGWATGMGLCSLCMGWLPPEWQLAPDTRTCSSSGAVEVDQTIGQPQPRLCQLQPVAPLNRCTTTRVPSRTWRRARLRVRLEMPIRLERRGDAGQRPQCPDMLASAPWGSCGSEGRDQGGVDS